MCDCSPLPPFPCDFSIRSRRPRQGACRSSSSSTLNPRNKSSINLPHLNPPLGGVRALTGGRLHDFKPRRSRSSSSGTNGGGGERRKYESLDELGVGEGEGSRPAEASPLRDEQPPSFDFLELKREMEEEEGSGGGSEEDELFLTGRLGNGDSETEEVGGPPGRPGRRGRRQVMRRCNLMAKQVISIQSACSLGFVSQLWVDTRSWVVVLVEVRPNLLSGDIEKFLLEDVCQVGDVVLIQDESVMENELKVIPLDTLVGYNVITSERQNVGKVRGYTFNINSGAVESLELDSFGISIIPSSLVSTYCLLVEDVLEVISDTVVVHEGSVSRLQRLTKGIWNTRNGEIYGDEMGENTKFGRQRIRPVHSRSNQKNSSKRKFRRRMREIEDDWDLPMDY